MKKLLIVVLALSIVACRQSEFPEFNYPDSRLKALGEWKGAVYTKETNTLIDSVSFILTLDLQSEDKLKIDTFSIEERGLVVLEDYPLRWECRLVEDPTATGYFETNASVTILTIEKADSTYGRVIWECIKQ
jgi:hypothetical protein